MVVFRLVSLRYMRIVNKVGKSNKLDSLTEEEESHKICSLKR
jgi:hypothetical protein